MTQRKLAREPATELYREAAQRRIILEVPVSDIELVVLESKRVARRMVVELGGDESATFQDRITALEHLFDGDVIQRLRRIGAIRNSLVHDVNENTLRDRRRFMDDCRVVNVGIDTAKRRLVELRRPTATSAVGATAQGGKGCVVLLTLATALCGFVVGVVYFVIVA